MSRLSQKTGHFDWVLIVLYFLLVAIGWVNIYSASYDSETLNFFDFNNVAVKQLWWDWFSSFNLYSTDQVQIFNDCYNDFPRQLIFHLFPRDNFFLFLLINDSHFLPLGILLQAKQKESLFDSLNGWHVWTGYDSLSFWE